MKPLRVKVPSRIVPYKLPTWPGIALVLVVTLVLLGSSVTFTASAPEGPRSSSPPELARAAAPETTVAGNSSGDGPHPGSLQIYENSGAGTTVDPAAAYYSLNSEPILNVYETLVAYNESSVGTDPTQFVPELATCVPGSTECADQFSGQTLVYPNLTTGAPQFYTFEIDAGARFYDPTTGASWPVYPSDVAFSFDRLMAFADPAGVYPGWIVGQALLPSAETSWDSGLHTPFNNTPQWVLDSLLVNDSAYCPAPSAGAPAADGCVTFDVGSSGLTWPDFLSFVAGPYGGAVEPCGVFTYLGAGLPGWDGTNATDGDGPCLLPGNSTSTSDSGFTAYVTSVSPTAWDAVESQTVENYPSPQPAVQWTMVGSGPYALAPSSDPIDPSQGYALTANPAYATPAGCAAMAGCLPAPGDYISDVTVHWESTSGPGLAAAANGTADAFDGLPTCPVESCLPEYRVESNLSTLEIDFQPLSLDFNVTSFLVIDPGANVTVPGNFLSDLGVRQFLAEAVPYGTLSTVAWQDDGVTTETRLCGVFPAGLDEADFNETTCPAQNPTPNATQPGNVAWWWAQLENSSSAWYDAAIAQNCSAASPCRFPMWMSGDTTEEATTLGLEIAAIVNLSSGALEPFTSTAAPTCPTACSTDLCIDGAGGCYPVYDSFWAPDFPDPSDYANGLLVSNATAYSPNSYTASDSVWATTQQPGFDNVSACGHSVADFANLSYWSAVGEIPDECQGVAYDVLDAEAAGAAATTDVAQRALEYDAIDTIETELALYIPESQAVAWQAYAQWIDPSSINANPMLGGSGIQLWFDWRYSPTYNVTFREQGLPAGTGWSVRVGPTTFSASGGVLNVSGFPAGSYPYSVGLETGYSVNPSSGTVSFPGGAGDSLNVTYVAVTGATYSVELQETGLATNTTWGVTFSGVGFVATSAPNVSVGLSAGPVGYQPLGVPLYTHSNGGVVNVSAGQVQLSVEYYPIGFSLYVVQFVPTGLTNQLWTVTLDGALLTSAGGPVTFVEPNGSYAFAVTPPTGWYTSVAQGTVEVRGADVTVELSFSNTTYRVDFNETGLASGGAWSVDVAGLLLAGANGSASTELPNGTYAFTVSGPAGEVAAPSSGTVVVRGAPVLVAVDFSPTTYSVVLVETGLTNASLWWVEITPPSGAGYNASATGDQIDLALANGSYNYSVSSVAGPPTGTGSTAASGFFVVSGAYVDLVFVFPTTAPTYTVTFRVSGATEWTIAIDGATLYGNGSEIQVSLPDGNYSYGVVAPPGYWAAPSGGTVRVAGAAATVEVSLYPVNGTGALDWEYLGTIGSGAVGVALGALVVAAIACGVAYQQARRRSDGEAFVRQLRAGEAEEP